jgi:hypothetical protein
MVPLFKNKCGAGVNLLHIALPTSKRGTDRYEKTYAKQHQRGRFWNRIAEPFGKYEIDIAEIAGGKSLMEELPGGIAIALCVTDAKISA